MALLALHIRVRTRQREVGAVMVKVCAVPTRGGMTYGAVRSELTVMLIVLFMAGITNGGRAFEDIVGMALLAFHFGMPALQLESGKVMVEGGFLPIGWVVAGLTVRAEGALVGILRSMTGIAILWRGRKIGQG